MFIAFLLSWIGVSVVPTRADCGLLTLDDYFIRSQIVFVGRAIGQQVVPIRPPSGTRATETTFEIEELSKRQADTIPRVQTCGWTEGGLEMTCAEGFTFVMGSRYLVFAAGDPLETSGCWPNGLVDRSERTLEWLASKPSKRLANRALELSALGGR
jgi:hypothetical protein